MRITYSGTTPRAACGNSGFQSCKVGPQPYTYFTPPLRTNAISRSTYRGGDERLRQAHDSPAPPKGHVALSMGGHGWVNFSLDGAYAWSHTPDIFDARTKKQIATLHDEHGKPFASSKLIEVHMRDGKVARIGSEFGIGRKE